MTENRQVNGILIGTGSSVAIGFLVGAMVGVGIALLLAPRTGRETRERIADAGRRWHGAARDMANDFKEDAKSALDAGREKWERSQKTHETPFVSTTESKG